METEWTGRQARDTGSVKEGRDAGEFVKHGNV